MKKLKLILASLFVLCFNHGPSNSSESAWNYPTFGESAGSGLGLSKLRQQEDDEYETRHIGRRYIRSSRPNEGVQGQLPFRPVLDELVTNPTLRAAINDGRLVIEQNRWQAVIKFNGFSLRLRLDGSYVDHINGFSLFTLTECTTVNDVLSTMLYAAQNKDPDTTDEQFRSTVFDLLYVLDIAKNRPIKNLVDNKFPFLPQNSFDFYQGFGSFGVEKKLLAPDEGARVDEFFSVATKIADILVELRKERRRTWFGSLSLKLAEVVNGIQEDQAHERPITFASVVRKIFSQQERESDPYSFLKTLDPSTLLEFNEIKANLADLTFPRGYILLAPKICSRLTSEEQAIAKQLIGMTMYQHMRDEL